MSKWKEYKAKLNSDNKEVKPWDFLNPNTEYATEEESDRRYEICKSCPELLQTTKQCKQCGCFMIMKSKLNDATCPIKKWDEEKIFISIASYRDPELKDTILSAIENAYSPKRLFFSIISQADENEHPDLSDIEDMVDGIEYVKINFKDSMGACWARGLAQKPLNSSYKYFLQIDSHMKFTNSWDFYMLSKYKKSKERWNKLIYTTYVYPYSYNGDQIEYFSSNTPTVACLKISNGDAMFEGTYKDYQGDNLGEKTNYFSGHFAFGESQIFIDTPYDMNLYFSGEEPSLAARFNDKDVNLVVPPLNFLYHRYDRIGRNMHWGDNELWWQIDRSSKDRLKKIFDGDPLDGYGVSDIEKLNAWKASAVIDANTI